MHPIDDDGPARAGRAPIVTSLLMLALPTMAFAQTVRGAVVAERTGEPLAGAFVVLVDEVGDRGNGVLAGPDGRFTIRAAAPGRYRLVTELIGFASTSTELLDLQPGPAVEYTIEVPVQAVDLAEIRVTGEARCESRPGAGAETFRLWEEARKALQVTQWGEEQRALRMQIRQYDRQLSPRGHAVREASERSRTGYYDRSPYESRPAEELDRLGYIREVGDNQYDYFGPDAEVLLSDVFMDTHCFRVVDAPDDEPGLIGLAFEPVRGRDLPDVEGVLWVDRGSAELRRLDFTYTRVPFADVRPDAAGGRVSFQRLATGMWIVDSWRIRMPLMALKQEPAWRSAQPTMEVVALNETGAEVQSVRGPDGTVLAQAAGATLYGTVFDSISAQPLSDATVELVGTERTTRTSMDGTYRFTDLPSGVYDVRFLHPELDLLGVDPAPSSVALESGQAVRLPLAIPSGPGIADAICGPEAGGAPAALVYGVVSDETETWPVRDAVVRLDATDGSAGRPRTVTADSQGVFRICVTPEAGRGLRVLGFRPGNAAAALAADPGPEASQTAVELAVDPPDIYRADLSVPVAAATVTATWSNVLTGAVVEESSHDPVAGATITLADSLGQPLASAVSDEAGHFRFAHPGQGSTFRLTVGHLGYAEASGEVTFGSRDELDIELVMAPRAIEIDPIVVVERRRDFLADRGYYLRKQRGLGRFIERETIERLRPSRIVDVLRREPGVQVLGEGLGQDIQFMGMKRAGGWSDNALMGGSGTGGIQCRPAIYLDGGLIRPGGDSEGYTHLNDVVPPELIEAIEMYRRVSEVPARFAGSGSTCGVVAIWTTR